MTDKNSPRLVREIERDVGRDLRKVGQLAKKIFGFTQRAEKALGELAKPDDPQDHPPLQIGPIEVLYKCNICNDSRRVGEGTKIPCPACSQKR